MIQTIVEDRVLARLAFEAVGWNTSAAPAELADIALGQAVVALRVMGVASAPEILRTLKADIALILDDPNAVARARSFTPRAAIGMPANTNLSPAPLAAVG